MDTKSSTSSRSPEDVQGQPVAKKSRLVCKTIIYDESIANQWLDEPPLEIWDHHIIPPLRKKGKLKGKGTGEGGKGKGKGARSKSHGKMKRRMSMQIAQKAIDRDKVEKLTEAQNNFFL